jgi:hypothetical protein
MELPPFFSNVLLDNPHDSLSGTGRHKDTSMIPSMNICEWCLTRSQSVQLRECELLCEVQPTNVYEASRAF